jgi:hypothetical protein
LYEVPDVSERMNGWILRLGRLAELLSALICGSFQLVMVPL